MSGSEFLFLGGDPAVDLVNTEMRVSGELVDRLGTPERLAAWVVAAGLAAETPWVPRAVFERVIGLRVALRSGFDEIAAGREVPAATLDGINQCLRDQPGSRLRRTPERGIERVSLSDIDSMPEWLPWLIADRAADLLSGPAAALPRHCAGRACVLYFVDTSRNHSRRWCSMEICGNRSKVAAHHQRTNRAAPTH